MAQNNSVFFVWKISNDDRERPNLRIVMNQVTNLKSLGFTWKKEQIFFEFLQVFYPHISIVLFVVEIVAKVVFYRLL